MEKYIQGNKEHKGHDNGGFAAACNGCGDVRDCGKRVQVDRGIEVTGNCYITHNIFDKGTFNMYNIIN